jgi:septum formation protein
VSEFLPALSTVPVILASASAPRANLLRAAGVTIEIVPSTIDEPSIVAALRGGGDDLPPADIAAMLAEAKAGDVGNARPDTLVIAADQTLELDGALFTKAGSIEEARRNLLVLRGRTHALHTCAVLAQEGQTVWRHSETAWMTMRDFTPQFLGRYLATVGDSVLESVGCYHLEGPGVQLFERFEGDWFSILGLPVMPLLEELRRRGAVPA